MAELIIAGFHRSGTSLLTELLHTAGLFVGDDLLGAMPSNLYGHFEDREVLRIHEQILRDNGLNWQADRPFVPYIHADRWHTMQNFADKRRVKHQLWGFKDPRVCFFLPAWKHILPGMKTIIVYREPAESVASLHRRQMGDLVRRQGSEQSHRRFWGEPDLGLRMWLAHNQALVAHARAYPGDTLVVSFNALAHGYSVIDHCNDRLDTGLAPTATFKVFDPTTAAKGASALTIYDPALVRATNTTLDHLRELEAAHRTEESILAT